MQAQIKICGITRYQDAIDSIELGAGLLGFNFYPKSPRYLSAKHANSIIKDLPENHVNVGVFVNEPIDKVFEVYHEAGLQSVQLHGDEINDDCVALKNQGVHVIKALRIRTQEDIQTVKNYDVDTYLLDAYREELYGGSGHVFDWSWIKGEQQQNVFLAGGIGPANIQDALAVGTYGIDLCSGVESEPGVKDPEKLKKLFAGIQEYYGN